MPEKWKTAEQKFPQLSIFTERKFQRQNTIIPKRADTPSRAHTQIMLTDTAARVDRD